MPISSEAKRAWIRPTTLGDLLDERAVTAGERESLVFPSERLSFSHFAAQADRVARALIAAGVTPGEHVGILLDSSVQYLATLFGAAKIGAVAVPINSRLKSQELAQVAGHAELAVLVTTRGEDGAPDYPALLSETYPELATRPRGRLDLADAPTLHTIVQLDGDPHPGLLSGAEFFAAARQVSADDVETRQSCVRLRDVALLLYTSGTSAAPKGVMHSHEALTRMAEALATTRLELRPEDRMWTTLPFFHIGGIAFVLACLTGGCTLVHVGHYQPRAALDVLELERCTVAMGGFETIWLGIINEPSFSDRDLSAVSRLHSVGAPDKLRQIAEAFPGATLFSSCGMTENCGMMSWALPTDTFEKRTQTGGPLMPGVHATIVDVETGLACPANQVGELLIKGAFLFDGYYRDPHLNSAVFDAQGWFHTGDLAKFDDDGYLIFVSRLKDMLKVGGENVAAAEVENFLATHPAVEMAQVVAAPDAYYTEVPAAFIQVAAGAAVTEAEIIEFCSGKIASFRIPRYVRFVEDWPMSSTKIKKSVLREQIAAELAATGITEAPRRATESRVDA
jgi:fatty-acyl-CoA synthase